MKPALMKWKLILLQDQETVSLGSYWCCANVVYWESQGWRRRDDQILTREQVFNCRTSRKVHKCGLGRLTSWYKVFLKQLVVIQLIKRFGILMAPKCSSPSLQKPTTYFTKINFNIILPLRSISNDNDI